MCNSQTHSVLFSTPLIKFGEKITPRFALRFTSAITGMVSLITTLIESHMNTGW